MAVTHHDQRKNYEEAQANAIGTEYARADLLPAKGAKAVRELLKRYLDQRILFYLTRDGQQINHINCETTTLQADLWSTVAGRKHATDPTDGSRRGGHETMYSMRRGTPKQRGGTEYLSQHGQMD